MAAPRQDLRANDWERWSHTARQAALRWEDELCQRDLSLEATEHALAELAPELKGKPRGKQRQKR